MRRSEQLAEVGVVVGANVQPGQVVQVLTDVAHLDMARAVADAAYRHGARFVEFDLRDAVLQRSLIVDGPARAYVPAWRDASTYGLDDVEGARIQINGHTAAGLLAGLDPVRVDRAQAPRSAAWREVEYRVNNTIIPGPDLEWAQALRPDLEPDPALDQLWDEIAIACRLDDPDPPQAWHRRFALLTKRAEWLTSLGLTALALRGPDTDLTVGLLPSTRWEPPTHRNQRGISHAWNIPSEELYTSPDPGRVEGCVRLTRPAVISGVEISDVSLTFTDGVLTHVTGGPGVERLRAFTDRDAGTRRVGEIALVDRESAVAQVAHPFKVNLLDENAACHLALGFGYPELVGAHERHRVNRSGDHLDLAIGSDDVEVSGVTPSGDTVPLLHNGRWVGNER
jgi:aminopeptidase